MPKITSARQFRAMEAAAHGHSNIGIPADVAAKGLAEAGHEKRSRFAKQGKSVIRLKRKKAKKQGGY